MTPLVFELRSHCGQRRYYASCIKSALLLDLANRKMLTQDEIEALRRVGFDLVIVGDSADKNNGGV